MKIAITGATGFVGRAFIERNLDKKIRGLGRRQRPSWLPHSMEWQPTDLYSLRDAENALQGCDVALYLVHSMLPSARLNQGSFEDTDLILADNFARAARKAKLKKIIYLGGILPELPDEELSQHLRSRKEVEIVLGSTGIPVISLRAALVLGPGGSSFEMMRKLVDRLPLMICPAWTSSLSNPVYLDDLLSVMEQLISEKRSRSVVINVPGPDELSYIDLMELTAEVMGKKRHFIPVSFYSPKLSLLWVRLITGSSRELVIPLVESLKHNMTAVAPAKYQKLLRTHIQEALKRSLDQTAASPAPRSHRSGASSRPGTPGSGASSQLRTPGSGPSQPEGKRKEVNLVRSVQRLPLPPGKDAIFVAELYPIWLQGKLKSLLKVERQPETGKVIFKGLGLTLLELTLAAERSDPTRQLYYVTGGILAATNSRGRLEFRTLPSVGYALSAVHDFEPALPWYIYKFTQAPMHLKVMNGYARFMEKLKEQQAAR